MSLFIVIPAFNEARSLPSVLRRLGRVKNKHIVLVDDGSTDQTAEVARQHDVRVLRLPSNTGAGAATANGLKRIHPSKHDVIVLMDADGQHDPTVIPRIVREVKRGADYVVASRYLQRTPATTSRIRVIGTFMISIWIWIWFGNRIYDPTSGYRGLSYRSFAILARQYPTFFSEPEVILMVIQHGLIIKEISSFLKPRIYGKSTISIGKALSLGIYIFVLIPFRAMRRRIST